MQKTMRRFILFLCFCMILPLLVSCAEKTTQHEVKIGENDEIIDTIEEGYSLNGDTVSIFYNSGDEDSIMGNDEVIDIVYSKIYERNLKVQNRLNVKLGYIESNHGSDWTNITTILSGYLLRREESFQIVMTGNNVLVQGKLFPMFHDLNDSEYIDINEDWYYKDAIMEMSVDFFYYRFLYGDIHISDIGRSGAIFYNKDLYEQYINAANRDYLYELVLDGTWTLDQFYMLTKHSHITRGGDGNGDIYGYSLFRYAEQIHHFANGCDIQYYARGKNGIPEITINNDKSVEFTTALYNLLYNNEGAWLFYPGQVGKESEHGDDFMNGKVMFLLDNIGTCLSDNMREMESDYGILPYPKWDENQEEYISLIHNSSAATGIPISVNLDDAMTRISAVLEALSSESFRTVRVPYYETALKTTYSRDDVASQVLDIITGQHETIPSRLIKNFLYEYTSSLNSVGSIFSDLMASHSDTFASKYATIEGAAKDSLRKLVEEYLKDSEGT